MAREARLSPGAIARELFTIDPDRDERAAQLCAETLLTLAQNGYAAPPAGQDLKSPKRRNYAVRSLALGENFLGGYEQGRAGDSETTPAGYGHKLASGQEVRGSANLPLARATLQGLVDPDTQRGQKGGWLMRPFHESLLWYDARPAGASFSVRKVYMRGSGITLARLLLDPPDPGAAALGREAVAAVRAALTAPSPLQRINDTLESALAGAEGYAGLPVLEPDEERAWKQGGRESLAPLASQLCRHAEGVMRQGGASGPAKLWQLRTVLALDLASHALRTAWDATGAPEADRYLLLSFGGAARAEDPVRQRSEDSLRRARIRLSDATVQTLARRMHELATVDKVTAWDGEFIERRGGGRLTGADPSSVSHRLQAVPQGSPREAYLPLAQHAVENADYGRAEEGFRVLLQSAGLLGGTRYPFMTASPDLLAAMVGALSQEMPMPSREFFAAARREWGFVVNQESSAATGLAGRVDGASLQRNARRAEQLMSEAGLALGLSDRTTVVGERARRLA